MKLWLRMAAVAGSGIAVGPLFAPALMAFPYQAQVGQHQIYSVKPLPLAIVSIVRLADTKVAESPSGSFRAPDQSIFLTGGGWRWMWLAGTSQSAFAITRAVNDAIIVNGADVANNEVHRPAAIGGRRSLSGVIAHEMTHASIRSHFGISADWRYPSALREGYCDFVAGEGSLSDAQAHALIQQAANHPALPYWTGRKRIERELASGADIDRLFAERRDVKRR